MTQQYDILLTTLNARYMHSAFGLRYLLANLEELTPKAKVIEFTIQEQTLNIAEQLLKYQPKIIGFSVYIWNIREITDIVTVIKQISPDTVIVLGGPEVGHYPDIPAVCDLADFVVSGPGEKSFRDLCRQILAHSQPQTKYIDGIATDLTELTLPYHLYNEEDIRNRLIYVEASRGCPFKCEFCLSALDKTATAFPLESFLTEMDALWQRGVRNFKFIDRTFNLKVSTSIRILEFFLERMTDDLYLHFEVVPDNLPDKLKEVLKRFPPQSLQFEIGIQTFDSDIQTLISRKQNNDKTRENIHWLREHTGAHLHTDLIFGLPSDTLDNFADSFNQLVALNPHEIQLGILKRLRGAPLNRHNDNFALNYNPQAPYNILSTSTVDFMTMQRVNRFARFWDMIGNSGRFINTMPLILADNAFTRFMFVSDRLFEISGSTWKIALKRLFELLFVVLTDDLAMNEDTVKNQLKLDYARAGVKGIPDYENLPSLNRPAKAGVANKRQRYHA